MSDKPKRQQDRTGRKQDRTQGRSADDPVEVARLAAVAQQNRDCRTRATAVKKEALLSGRLGDLCVYDTCMAAPGLGGPCVDRQLCEKHLLARVWHSFQLTGDTAHRTPEHLEGFDSKQLASVLYTRDACGTLQYRRCCGCDAAGPNTCDRVDPARPYTGNAQVRCA
jgi:hypothetical protein